MIILVPETWPQGDQEAGNSWWVVVYTGRDPLTGKKRQKTGTAKTSAEARQLEARLIREAGTGQHRAVMAQDPELGLFLVLAVVLGARRGEVCRLRWSHIDLDRG